MSNPKVNELLAQINTQRDSVQLGPPEFKFLIPRLEMLAATLRPADAKIVQSKVEDMKLAAQANLTITVSAVEIQALAKQLALMAEARDMPASSPKAQPATSGLEEVAKVGVAVAATATIGVVAVGAAVVCNVVDWLFD